MVESPAINTLTGRWPAATNINVNVRKERILNFIPIEKLKMIVKIKKLPETTNKQFQTTFCVADYFTTFSTEVVPADVRRTMHEPCTGRLSVSAVARV